ncbi:MAG: hypothetical protein PHC66_02005 [Candidatus Nanoarchaeia archaeon]|nr:hypothetical protein [Candidatus Nanoarchaeia archaeon]MDD5239062.1 hypothetical protein [Candidatus Nanoarchaeia archaeon]
MGYLRVITELHARRAGLVLEERELFENLGSSVDIGQAAKRGAYSLQITETVHKSESGKISIDEFVDIIDTQKSAIVFSMEGSRIFDRAEAERTIEQEIKKYFVDPLVL